MNVLYIAPVGEVVSAALDWVEAAAGAWFSFPVRRLPGLPVPTNAYDASRRQYESVELMKALARRAPPDTARLLGITELDLAIPMLTFLFGQAQLDGPVAVMSLCRLHQEFYGLPADGELLRERVVKEALHELGHTFGLTHCSESQSLATHIGLVDRKSESYCPHCRNRLARRLAAGDGEAA